MLDAQLIVSGETFDRQITNISLTGVCVAHDRRLPIGQRVDISFRIPTLDTAIEVGGHVRWSGDDQCGLQLDGLRARDVFGLNKFFDSLTKQNEG